MPSEHRDWVSEAVLQLRAQMVGLGGSWTGFLVVGIEAWMPRPKTRPAWFPRDAWKSGIAWATPTKPDADNIAKIVLDSMVEAGLLEDDRFVCELHVHRAMCGAGSEPGITITVEDWSPAWKNL